MKTKLINICVLLLAGSIASGQTASYDANSSVVYPFGFPGNNCGFGVGAFNNNIGTTSFGITAMGTNALPVNSTGNFNTALGTNALFSNSNAPNNTAVGYQSLYSNDNGTGGANDNTGLGVQSLFSNTSGYNNTAVGKGALYSNTGGFNNTAIGFEALRDNAGSGVSLGRENTAAGYRASAKNTSGYSNTALGVEALHDNTIGYDNTAIGYRALFSNDVSSGNIGFGNVAAGHLTMYYNVSGAANTAVGKATLFQNVDGACNVAFGTNAQGFGTSSSFNVALGTSAGYSNPNGQNNVAIGQNALYNYVGYNNIAVGRDAMRNVVGTWPGPMGNTAVGYMSFGNATALDDNTLVGNFTDLTNPNLTNASCFGYGAVMDSSDMIQLGGPTVWRVGGEVMLPSDVRFKTNITEKEVIGLDFITRLKPVAYYMDTKKFYEFSTPNIPDSIRKELRLDFTRTTAIRQSGFMAQDVEQAALETGYNFSGLFKPQHDHDPYSLSYATFVVPLVKAVQEQQKMIEQQQAEKAELREKIRTLSEQLGGTGDAAASPLLPLLSSSGSVLSYVKKDQQQAIEISGTALPAGSSLAVYNKGGRQMYGSKLNEGSDTVQSVRLPELASGDYYYALLQAGKVVEMHTLTIH